MDEKQEFEDLIVVGAGKCTVTPLEIIHLHSARHWRAMRCQILPAASSRLKSDRTGGGKSSLQISTAFSADMIAA